MLSDGMSIHDSWKDWARFFRIGTSEPSSLAISIRRYRARGKPATIFTQLDLALAGNYKTATAGLRNEAGQMAIDHLSHTFDLECDVEGTLPSQLDGLSLSDHFGIVASLRSQSEAHGRDAVIDGGR
jgi:hypothetical protein